MQQIYKWRERERVCLTFFVGNLKFSFSAVLGRNFSYFQSLLVHHLSSMTSFNHKTFCWLQISKFQLTLTYQQIARKERNCYDNCFVCNFIRKYVGVARANLHLERLATLQPNRPPWLRTFFKKFSRGRRRGCLDGGGGGRRGR